MVIEAPLRQLLPPIDWVSGLKLKFATSLLLSGSSNLHDILITTPHPIGSRSRESKKPLVCPNNVLYIKVQ